MRYKSHYSAMILQGACAPIQCILLYGACLFLTRLHFLIKGGIFDDEPRDYDKIRQSNILFAPASLPVLQGIYHV